MVCAGQRPAVLVAPHGSAPPSCGFLRSGPLTSKIQQVQWSEMCQRPSVAVTPTWGLWLVACTALHRCWEQPGLGAQREAPRDPDIGRRCILRTCPGSNAS